jgi:hypothetical protein
MRTNHGGRAADDIDGMRATFHSALRLTAASVKAPSQPRQFALVSALRVEC